MPDSVRMEVTATFDTLINGQYLRTLVVKNTNEPGPARDTIIERLGSIFTFYPRFVHAPHRYLCDGWHASGLRCYEDAVLGLYETGIVPSCEHSTVGVENIHAENSPPAVYPNPAAEELFIRTTEQVTVTDISGRAVHLPQTVEPDGGVTRIDIRSLSGGVYIAHIGNEAHAVRFVVAD